MEKCDMRSERTRDAAIPPKENALPVPCIHRFIIFDVFFKICFEASLFCRKGVQDDF